MKNSIKKIALIFPLAGLLCHTNALAAPTCPSVANLANTHFSTNDVIEYQHDALGKLHHISNYGTDLSWALMAMGETLTPDETKQQFVSRFQSALQHGEIFNASIYGPETHKIHGKTGYLCHYWSKSMNNGGFFIGLVTPSNFVKLTDE